MKLFSCPAVRGLVFQREMPMGAKAVNLCRLWEHGSVGRTRCHASALDAAQRSSSLRWLKWGPRVCLERVGICIDCFAISSESPSRAWNPRLAGGMRKFWVLGRVHLAETDIRCEEGVSKLWTCLSVATRLCTDPHLESGYTLLVSSCFGIELKSCSGR